MYIDPETGLLATKDCPDKKLEVFVQGTEPTEFCTAHGEGESEPLPPPAEEEKKESHSWWNDLKRWWMD
ncbi:hypothetical protein D3C81_1342570 [compost metagenome]